MKISKDAYITVKELIRSAVNHLEISLKSNDNGMENRITSSKVQKLGLRLIEDNLKLEKGRIQVIGKTEIAYLKRLTIDHQKALIKKLSTHKVPCFIFSKGIVITKLIEDEFMKTGVPLFYSNYETGTLITVVNDFLAEKLAPKVNVHGVLLDIDRVGVLILGKSGIGKSECAIDLIIKGAKLVADDVVEIRKVAENRLIGTGPENIRFLIEVRGIGIVNIRDLFGTTSVMNKREIEMVIELDSWDSTKEYERLGIDKKTKSILDVKLPHTVIPVSPGRNMASIIEVAVRNQILKTSEPYTFDKNILN